jgi:hypothetical protein
MVYGMLLSSMFDVVFWATIGGFVLLCFSFLLTKVIISAYYETKKYYKTKDQKIKKG